MNVQDFIDFGADILNNFKTIPDLLLTTEVLGTPMWTIVLGTGLGAYLGWLVAKWIIGL